MQLLLTTKRHFTIVLWMPVRLSTTTPASLNGCSGPWWDMLRHKLNPVENILSIYYKCTPSAITHKLNVSGHMMIWTFFLGLVCGTHAQCLSTLISYTLYNSPKLYQMVGSLWAIETFENIIIHNLYFKLVSKYKTETWTLREKIQTQTSNEHQFSQALKKKDKRTHI
jgi:hypothetical protein